MRCFSVARAALLAVMCLGLIAGQKASAADAASRITDANPNAPFVPQVVAIFRLTHYVDAGNDQVQYDQVGTGTLISPTHVLTAAHVVTDDYGTVNSAPVKIGLYSDSATLNETINAAKVYVHSSWHGAGPNGEYLNTDGIVDAAIIEMGAEPVDVINGDLVPLPVGRAASTAGQTLLIGGFGRIGNGTIGETSQPENMDTTADGYDIDVPNYYAGFTSVESLTTDYIQWKFNSGESNTAHGDSGGPALIAASGQYYVTGITSGGSGDRYGAFSFDTKVESALPFIDAVCGFTDLTATGTVASLGTIRKGQSMTFGSTIANIGYLAAPAFTVSYKLSTDGLWHDTDPTLADFRFSAGLAARSQGDASFTIPVPNAADGQYYIVWNIDCDGEVNQSDTANDIFLAGNPITIKTNSAPVISGGISVTPSPSYAGQTLTFGVSANDADNDTLTAAWDYGDGTAAGSSPAHVYAKAGTYTVAVTVSDGYGGSASTSGSITVLPNNAPQFSSAASASPSPAFTNTSVTFTASGADSDSDALTYTWDFGDGSAGSGSSASHTYTASGTYTAQVSVSDGKGGVATSSVTLTVIELKVMTSWKHKFQLNFSRGKYSDTLDCTFGNADFAKYNFGGAKFCIGSTSVACYPSWNTRKKEIRVKLSRASLQETMAIYGAKNETRYYTSITVPMYLVIGGVYYAADVKFGYSAKEGKKGAGK